jgi:tetratricopeptide (TPR) repeat protein
MALNPQRTRRAIEFTVLLLCIAVASAYAWLAARNYLSLRASSSRNGQGLQRAISLEPQRATYHDLLGRDLMLQSQDPTPAVAEFRKAVALNPYESSYWLDLAEAYYSMGAKSDEDQAIRRAITVDPTTPSVAWNTANFLLLQGNLPAALPQFSVVLQHSPERVPAALDTLWRAVHDVNAIEAILPPDPDVYLQFIKVLIAQNDAKDAQTVWSRLFELNRPYDFRDALFYVDYLLSQREVSQATGVWKQLVSRSPELAKYSEQGNSITDGDFSEEILNGGFDWHYSARRGADITLDSNNSHSTGRSLSITYSGSGADSGLFQDVPVRPKTWYTLSAWAKSDDLQTANGPELVALDPDNEDVRAATQPTSGTTAWHLVHTNFVTGNNSKLLHVHITRDPDTTQIQGRFWITELSLKEMPALPKQ